MYFLFNIACQLFIASLFFVNFVLTDTFRFLKIKTVDCIVNLFCIKFKNSSHKKNTRIYMYMCTESNTTTDG